MFYYKQLFFSHTWRDDDLGRDTHERVYQLVKILRNMGWTTWFDEEDMNNNIDSAMARGIDNADAIIVCLTKQYILKVNNAANNPRIRDNCFKEWNYSNNRFKLIIPVIMEPSLLNTNNWPPGVVSLYLSNNLYVNASDNNYDNAASEISRMLIKNYVVPYEKLVLNNQIQFFVNKLLNKKRLNSNFKYTFCEQQILKSYYSVKEKYKMERRNSLENRDDDKLNKIKKHDSYKNTNLLQEKKLCKNIGLPAPPKHRKPPNLPNSVRTSKILETSIIL